MRKIIFASVSILITAMASAASAETMYQPAQQYADQGRVVYDQRPAMNMAAPLQQAPVANRPAPATSTNNIMQFNFGM